MSEQLVITSAKSAIMSTSLTGLALRRPCAEYPDVAWIICAHLPPGGTLAVRLGSPFDRLLRFAPSHWQAPRLSMVEPGQASYGDNDLAAGVALFEVTDSLGNLVEWERPVHGRRELS
jgi:hypothetical protein